MLKLCLVSPQCSLCNLIPKSFNRSPPWWVGDENIILVGRQGDRWQHNIWPLTSRPTTIWQFATFNVRWMFTEQLRSDSQCNRPASKLKQVGGDHTLCLPSPSTLTHLHSLCLSTAHYCVYCTNCAYCTSLCIIFFIFFFFGTASPHLGELLKIKTWKEYK